VAGDAAIGVDPTDVDDLAVGLRTALADDEVRERLRRAGPARAAGFTWKDAAHRTVGVYQLAAGSASS
jgi:glycosyltransferase involved in cell wall biosynthesis